MNKSAVFFRDTLGRRVSVMFIDAKPTEEEGWEFSMSRIHTGVEARGIIETCQDGVQMLRSVSGRSELAVTPAVTVPAFQLFKFLEYAEEYYFKGNSAYQVATVS
jgi:hypothetical protein